MFTLHRPLTRPEVDPRINRETSDALIGLSVAIVDDRDSVIIWPDTGYPETGVQRLEIGPTGGRPLFADLLTPQRASYLQVANEGARHYWSEKVIAWYANMEEDDPQGGHPICGSADVIHPSLRRIEPVLMRGQQGGSRFECVAMCMTHRIHQALRIELHTAHAPVLPIWSGWVGLRQIATAAYLRIALRDGVSLSAAQAAINAGLTLPELNMAVAAGLDVELLMMISALGDGQDSPTMRTAPLSVELAAPGDVLHIIGPDMRNSSPSEDPPF